MLSTISAYTFPDNSIQYSACPNVQSGTSDILFTNTSITINNNTGSKTITFPKAFVGIPIVMLTLVSNISTGNSNTAFICWINTVSESNFTLSIANGFHDEITANIWFCWLAFENPTTTIPPTIPIGYKFHGNAQLNNQYFACPSIQKGIASNIFTSLNQGVQKSQIFFPKSFNTKPNVLVNIESTVNSGENNTAFVCWVYDIQVDSFYICAVNCWDVGISSNISFNWIATGNLN